MKEVVIKIPSNFAVEEAADFREKVYGLISEGITHFLLDFSCCSFIDSTGLGVLVSIYKKCKEQNGSLKLCNINDKVLKVFKLTRLDNVFDITNM